MPTRQGTYPHALLKCLTPPWAWEGAGDKPCYRLRAPDAQRGRSSSCSSGITLAEAASLAGQASMAPDFRGTCPKFRVPSPVSCLCPAPSWPLQCYFQQTNYLCLSLSELLTEESNVMIKEKTRQLTPCEIPAFLGRKRGLAQAACPRSGCPAHGAVRLGERFIYKPGNPTPT